MADKITELIHHPYAPPAGFKAVPPGVYKASTVMFSNVAALRSRSWKSREAYTYGLHGTPTSFTLEERIATLEGGTHCVLAPSGLAALNLVNLALLQQGDEVLLPHNVYGPSKEAARTLLARMGVSWREYDAMDAASLAALCGPRTRLVWLEAPGSVTMEFPDLRGLVAAARSRCDAVLALDNTWGAGLAFAPFEMGVDVAMHALTKYPSGGGDVLMGSVVTRDEALAHRILQMHGITGLGVAANDIELVLRGLPTLRVRYEAHDLAARELARWLQTQPQVSRVLHPALPGSPGHEHWASHCSAAAGLFSILLDERFAPAQIDAFVDGLQRFKIGYSWGGPVSLVVPYEIRAMRSTGTVWPGHLVRFSIGLEAVQDLRADLAQALQHAFAC
ncbi:MAG: PLP-dependent transferase [Rubrivivax sp.]|nr:PLP-dependent transferase [Rubrivivax sp.]